MDIEILLRTIDDLDPTLLQLRLSQETQRLFQILHIELNDRTI